MSTTKKAGFILLTVLLIGCGYYAGNRLIKHKLEQDLEAIYAQLPAEESVHDYEVVPIDGQCDGSTFNIERGGFSLIEYDRELAGFTLSTYRPVQVRALTSGCMDILDVVQVCGYELDGLLNKAMPMNYAYHGTYEEHLLHSHRAQGLIGKLRGLSSLETDFYRVEPDDEMTGFPVSLRNQARYKGQPIHVMCEGKKRIRYGVAEQTGKANTYKLVYRLVGMLTGALVSLALFRYATRS